MCSATSLQHACAAVSSRLHRFRNQPATCQLCLSHRCTCYPQASSVPAPPPLHHPPFPPSLHRAPVTALNLEGYGLAFLAVLYYNYSKLKSMQQSAAAAPKPEAADAQAEEGERLLSGSGSSAPSGSGAAGAGSGQVQLATPRRLQAGS